MYSRLLEMCGFEPQEIREDHDRSNDHGNLVTKDRVVQDSAETRPGEDKLRQDRSLPRHDQHEGEVGDDGREDGPENVATLDPARP